jgi:signal transduction histidine kinase/CheY-like chemotaxis protein
VQNDGEKTGSVPINSAERTERVARELLKILFRNIKVGLAFNIGLALLLVLGLYQYLPHLELLLWLGVQVGLNLVRYYVCWSFEQHALQHSITHWRRLALIGTVLAAFAWAYSGVFFLSPPELLPRALVLMILAGVTAGSTRILMAYPLASISFIALILIPVLLTVLYLPEIGSWTLSMATAAYFVFLTISSLALQADVVQVIEKNLANDELVQELGAVRAQLASIPNVATALMTTAGREIHTSLQQLHHQLAAYSRQTNRRDVDVDLTVAQELTEVSQALLLLGKIQGKSLEVQSHPVLLRALISESWAALAVVAEDRGVALQVEVDALLPAAITGDFLLLQRALAELLRQAVQHAKPGELLLQLQVSELSVNALPALRIVMQTAGSEVAATERPLLHSYYQHSATQLRTNSAFELRLVTVAELLHYLGSELYGEFTATTCSFAFVLPLVAAEFTLPEPVLPASTLLPVGQAAPSKKLKALLRVDDLSSRLVLEYLLRLAGHEPVVIAHDAEAVNVLSECAWDLVFIDQVQPSALGLDLLSVLASNPRYNTLSVIRLCERQNPRDVWPACVMGIIDKPPRKHEVEACIKRLS